jgi:uncharacterized protein YdeI (YjbR/CyaY-like superfamily)
VPLKCTCADGSVVDAPQPKALEIPPELKAKFDDIVKILTELCGEQKTEVR